MSNMLMTFFKNLNVIVSRHYITKSCRLSITSPVLRHVTDMFESPRIPSVCHYPFDTEMETQSVSNQNKPRVPTYEIRPLATNHVTDGYAMVPTDFDKLRKLLMSDYEPIRCRKEAHDDIMNPYVPLKRIMQKFLEREYNGHLQVSYRRVSGDTTSLSADPRDRAYPTKCISAGGMKREVRAALYHNILMDFDQASSHQSLILSALRVDPELPRTDWIQYYVDNKTAVRETIANKYFGGDVPKAKQLFQKIMFGGATTIQDDCVQGMIRELRYFCRRVVESNVELHATIKRRTKAKNAAAVKKAVNLLGLSKSVAEHKYGNKSWEASLMSLWCRNKEQEVIEAVLGWAINEGLVQNRRFDNSFDGLMIPLDDVRTFLKVNTQHTTIKDLLHSFHQIGKDYTGYDVKWEYKSMEAGHDKYWREYDEFEQSIQRECPDYFDRQLLINMPSAHQRLQYFGKHFHYIEDQHKVLHYQDLRMTRPDGTLVSERNLLWSSSKDFMSTFGHLPSGLLNDKGIDQPLAKLWFESKDRSQYAKVDAFPYAGVYDEERSDVGNVFNTFAGYPKDVWDNPSDTEFSEADMWKQIGPYVQLASHLAGAKCYDAQGLFPRTLEEYPEADRIQVELLLYFLGHRIAHPEQPRLPYYVCIQSECGVGKNSIMEPLSRLVGQTHYKCSSNMEDYCGSHAEGLMSKIIAVLNEADISSTAKVTSRFKEFITEDQQTSNAKFMRPFDYAVWAAIVVLTNSKVPMRIEPMNRERRIILFESNNFTARRWGNDIWSFLHSRFRSLPFLRALRQFFTTRDYNGFDFRKARAANLKLPAYTQLAMHFTPVEVMFVRNYIESGQFSMNRLTEENPRFWTMNGWDSNVTVKAKDFHELSKVYYKEVNLTSAATERSFHAFNQKIEALTGIDKVMVDRTVHFRLNPCEVYRDLLSKCLVDSDSVDPELLVDLHTESDPKCESLNALDIKDILKFYE